MKRQLSEESSSSNSDNENEPDAKRARLRPVPAPRSCSPTIIRGMRISLTAATRLERVALEWIEDEDGCDGHIEELPASDNLDAEDDPYDDGDPCLGLVTYEGEQLLLVTSTYAQVQRPVLVPQTDAEKEALRIGFARAMLSAWSVEKVGVPAIQTGSEWQTFLRPRAHLFDSSDAERADVKLILETPADQWQLTHWMAVLRFFCRTTPPPAPDLYERKLRNGFAELFFGGEDIEGLSAVSTAGFGFNYVGFISVFGWDGERATDLPRTVIAALESLHADEVEMEEGEVTA